MADGPLLYSLCCCVKSLRPQIYIFFFNCLSIVTEKKIVLSLWKVGLLVLLVWQRSCLLNWSRMRASIKRNREGGNRKCNRARSSPACEITRFKLIPLRFCYESKNIHIFMHFPLKQLKFSIITSACPWHFVMISVYWGSYDEIINYFKKCSTSENEKPAQHLDR